MVKLNRRGWADNPFWILHFGFVRLSTVHENQNSADIDSHLVKIFMWLQEGISWPHLRGEYKKARYLNNLIDINFNFYSDTPPNRDPDSHSPTLRRYHKILWSKPLPSGKIFELCDNKNGVYLYHKSGMGEFFLGSDAITHSYKNHKRKYWLTKQIPGEVDELFNTGSTIGAYTIFPNNRIGGNHTINQARGVNGLIDDRFDLTLECIRLFYLGQKSPLYDTLLRYKNFFDLFGDFIGYVQFFLLEDLIDENKNIKFYLPFDNFKTRPAFSDIDEYLLYKNGVIDFIQARNNRIENDANQQTAV